MEEVSKTKTLISMNLTSFYFFPAKHQTATIVCKSKSSGWYPKAFHQLKDGFCDFQEPTVVLGLHKGCFQQMQNIIGGLIKQLHIDVNCSFSY